MFKKLFALFIVLSIIFVFCLTPVSAAEEIDYRSINVLDYCFPNETEYARAYLSNSQTCYFALPFSFGLVYFDLVCEFYSAPSSVFIETTSGTKISLTFSLIEGRTYRVYGKSSTNVNSTRFNFGATFADSGSYLCLFHNFDVYTIRDPAVDEIGELRVTPGVNGLYNWQTMPVPGSTIGMNLENWAKDGYQAWEAEFSSVNWRKFDYLDFRMYLHVTTVDSIIAVVRTSDGSYNIPFDISWLNGEAISNNQFIANGEYVSQMGQLNAQSTLDITMRLYIPEYVRDEGSLIITMQGKYPSSGNNYYVSLRNVTGYYTTSVPEPNLVKLDQIETAIKNSLSSSAAQNAAASQSNQKLTASQTKADAGSATLNSMNKPSINDMGFTDPDLIVNTDGVNLLVQMISPLYENELILALMLAAAALAHLSYCYFGRK